MNPRRFLVPLVVLLFALAGCGGSPTEPSDYEFGRIDVYVRDTAGQPINGVPVRLDRRDGPTEDTGGASGSVGLPGYFFFLRTSGQFRVVITVPAEYTLASNQTSSIDVQFEREVTKTVNFVLQRR